MILSEKNDLNQEEISTSSNNENEFQELDNEIEKVVRGKSSFEEEETKEKCNNLNNSLNTDDSSNENIKKSKSKNNNEKIIINNKENNFCPQNKIHSLKTSKNLIIPHLMNSDIKNFNNASYFKNNIKSNEKNNNNNIINSESKFNQFQNVEPDNRNINEKIKQCNSNQNNNMNYFNLSTNYNNNNLNSLSFLHYKNNLNDYINNSKNLNELNFINNIGNNIYNTNFGQISNTKIKNIPLSSNNDYFLLKLREANNNPNNIIINNKILSPNNIYPQLICNNRSSNNISNQNLNFYNQYNQNNFNSIDFNNNINMNLSQYLQNNCIYDLNNINIINQIKANNEISMIQQKQNQIRNNQILFDLVLNRNINSVNNNKILNDLLKKQIVNKKIRNYNQKNLNNSNKKKIFNPLPDSEKEKNVINLMDILQFKDKRTTLMIKNIPNKYTLSTFLDDINVYFKNTYDIFYLPIDYINKCNLGFAFINFVEPLHIILFYELYRGKKWKKFNSDKICELLYAKIQGRNELISHFEKGKVLSFDSENKRPLILPVPHPLPRINLPCYYLDLFINLYPYVYYKINNSEANDDRSSSPLSKTFSIDGNFIIN